MTKDYKVGSRFIVEGKIVKVIDNSELKLQCDGNCIFCRRDLCLDYRCSDRLFKLSRLNKLIFWKKKINKE